MASFLYKTDKFYGIDQSQEDNCLSPGCATDARNMCTDDGNLSVATGFSRVTRSPLPTDDTIYRTVIFHHKDGNIYVAAVGNSLYIGYGNSWLCMHTYSTELSEHDFDFLEAKIGTEDYLLIGNGETGLLKYDGHEFSDFGSHELMSDRPVRYLAMYKNRLFAAGDRDFPNRLYWSKLPGDNRSIEDWSSDSASVNVSGGHTEIGMFDNDPIVAIKPLASQLLIFKKNSIYRLYGDKPSDFTVEKIDVVTEYAPHTAIVHYGDVAFYLTRSGMYVFDGVNAHLMKDADKIKRILSSADVSVSHGTRTREKLIFSAKICGDDALIEYDMRRQTYMIRSGFQVSDIFTHDNTVYVVCDRYVCRFDGSLTYAGAPIHALWDTPMTDLNQKTMIKQLCELYLRGDMKKTGQLLLTTRTGGISRNYNVRLIDNEVTEIPLCDEGRAFSLRYENMAGGSFSLLGGTELRLNLRGRCI